MACNRLWILWMHGVRNQFYFQLNELILMTFEYVGNDFHKDMEALAAYPEVGSLLTKKRRKDVTPEEMTLEEQYRSMLSGYMADGPVENDISFSEDDWSESVHI